MITFKKMYENRKKEIEDFLQLMEFMEEKENNKVDGISEFSAFFHAEEKRINLSYQAMINILKSNISLMIYNIIEFTVANLIDSIYDEIRIKNLSYIDVNECIKALWRKSMLKAASNPDANFKTFLKKNEELIVHILEKSTLEMNSRNTLPGGNLDGVSICETMESHGITVETHSKNYRPDILRSIKTNRNNLAHGSVSFVDAVREDSIFDIKNTKDFVVAFLEELIDSVSKYINGQGYKASVDEQLYSPYVTSM